MAAGPVNVLGRALADPHPARVHHAHAARARRSSSSGSSRAPTPATRFGEVDPTLERPRQAPARSSAGSCSRSRAGPASGCVAFRRGARAVGARRLRRAVARVRGPRVALTLFALGVQIVFGSFFVALITMRTIESPVGRSGRRPRNDVARPMRVCVLYDHVYPATAGGGEKWLHDVGGGRGSRPRRHLRHACATGGRRRRRLRSAGVRVVGITPAGTVYRDERRRLGPPLRFGLAVARHLARHGRSTTSSTRQRSRTSR